jgi:hypothetical protein
MLRGVTGGVFPPPPQASSNPDRKKLDTKARELNRITSSQTVSKASLSHSAFVERVPGARAAFCWRRLPRLLIEWHAGGMRRGRSTHARTSRNTLFPSHCDLQGLCGGLLLSGSGGTQATVENARPGVRQKIFAWRRRILSVSIHENVNNGFQPRAHGQKATESVTEDAQE